MVRLWWNSSEKRVFNIVDRFTSKYVSNVLSFQEISSVQTSTQLFNGMTVKARATTREVMATYTIEDIVIELIIQLPSNYPLGSITVESGKRIGVAVQQWRNWMLQLSTYLTHQNGSIMEGLALWKNNVDKRFEGVEDCMICFSVIHGFNYSLPKKACRTCKKKFHSACLYKWFTSSNKSTCPLCRETFFWVFFHWKLSLQYVKPKGMDWLHLEVLTWSQWAWQSAICLSVWSSNQAHLCRLLCKSSETFFFYKRILHIWEKIFILMA